MQPGRNFLEGGAARGDVWTEKQRVIADDGGGGGKPAENRRRQNQNLDLVIKVFVPDWKVMAFSSEPHGQLVWERQVRPPPQSPRRPGRGPRLTPAPPCLPQFCTPIASAWLVGGGKVTPIALFDDNGYSDQSEADEEDEDDDAGGNGRSSESSFYLGEEASSHSHRWIRRGWGGSKL